MKIVLKLIAAILISFVTLANAKIQTGNHIFDSNMKMKECLGIAQAARISLFEEKFGEIIAENEYTYIQDNIHISVLCLENKDTIVVSVATQDLEACDYLKVFSEHFQNHIDKNK